MSTGSEITVVAPKDIHESIALSKQLSASALIPQALRKKPEDVLAIVLAGAERGLAPMQALAGMHVISGKIAMSADMLAAQVLRRPDVCEYLTPIESTAKIATYEAKRKGAPAPVRMSFTIQQAHAAGLLGNATYQRFPDAMLRARCVAAICRAVFPDLCFGLYVEGELDAPIPAGVPHPAPAQSERAATIKEAIRESVAPKVPEKPDEVTDAEFEPVAGPSAEERIAQCQTVDALTAYLPTLRQLPAERQAVVGPIFQARFKALKAASTPKP